MGEKGQIDISFGMIFSIIIIIATVSIGFYVITYFLNLSSCTKAGLFWDSLNSEVDKAWNGDIAQTILKKEVPSGIKSVCFGNFSQVPLEADKKIFLEFKNYEIQDRNAYFYPSGKTCNEFEVYNLRHAKMDNFFCVQAKSGEMSVKISKTGSEALVRLSTP